MANSFLTALEGKKKQPRQPMQNRFPNLLGLAQGAAGPNVGETPMGVVTTQPGESTRDERNHPGIDIANEIGTKLPALTGGAVTAVQKGQKKGSPGFGNYVIITDEQGNRHRYSHLKNSMVKLGDNVQPGQSIGTMGNSGQTYSPSGGNGSHLDYRILDAYGRYVDPTFYVDQYAGQNK